MNYGFQELMMYVEGKGYNEVAFICFSGKNEALIYNKGINCLEVEGKDIVAFDKWGNYTITKRHDIIRNQDYLDIINVYDTCGIEVLTIFIKKY